MYHGLVFANTGRLMVVPGQAGYPADYKNDPGKQLTHAPRFDRFGDFFFISFAADGEDLATYLAGAGDYLKLVSEQSSKGRSEEHTSELQSLMRISYAVFCLKKKKT